MSNKNLKIDGDNVGRRIDNYLFNVYKALPKSKIYSMLTIVENILSNLRYFNSEICDTETFNGHFDLDPYTLPKYHILRC